MKVLQRVIWAIAYKDPFICNVSIKNILRFFVFTEEPVHNLYILQTLNR